VCVCVRACLSACLSVYVCLLFLSRAPARSLSLSVIYVNNVYIYIYMVRSLRANAGGHRQHRV
jgi:hypothetical protein